MSNNLGYFFYDFVIIYPVHALKFMVLPFYVFLSLFECCYHDINIVLCYAAWFCGRVPIQMQCFVVILEIYFCLINA